MKKIQIGKSSIKSSVIGLGAINFGTRIDEESAFKLMDCYKENGGNLNKDLTLVAYSPLLGGQYNTSEIKKDEYRTYYNEMKLKKLLKEQSDPNAYVLNYINNQYGGSIALLTTSNIEHMEKIMKSEFFK